MGARGRTTSLQRGHAGWELEPRAPPHRQGTIPSSSDNQHALWAQGGGCVCHPGAGLYFNHLCCAPGSAPNQPAATDTAQWPGWTGSKKHFPEAPMGFSQDQRQDHTAPPVTCQAWWHFCKGTCPHEATVTRVPMLGSPVQPHGETKCQQMLLASGPFVGLPLSCGFLHLQGLGEVREDSCRD